MSAECGKIIKGSKIDNAHFVVSINFYVCIYLYIFLSAVCLILPIPSRFYLGEI